MDRISALSAIEDILADLPDSELPQFSNVEIEMGKVIVWHGGHGHNLGSAKRNGVREPLIYRRNGAWAALEAEAVYRADLRLLDHGPVADLEDARKVVRG